METFVLRWTKDNLPFWQGVDDGEKIEINAVADVINENAALKRGCKKFSESIGYDNGPEDGYAVVDPQDWAELDALLTKETNDD